jgi:quercetin dioxygenase-like cupin family protein
MTLRHTIAGALALVALACTQHGSDQTSSAEVHRQGAEPAAAVVPPAAAPATMPSHKVVRPEEIKWVDGPPSLPPGAKFAVLEGDPSSSGFFVMRAMLPANYRIPPHWHPAVERVTVLSGTMHLGMGERFDQGAGQDLPAGAYATMPPGMRHFAWTEGPVEIQIGTLGPWGIIYVNPADDPRKAKQ